MVKNNRTVIHADLDTFFVSVERLLDHTLIGKPVLIGGSSDRSVVASCSYESRKYGVHSAMPMKLAKKLCPNAKIVIGNMAKYSKYSKLVTQIIAEEAPVYEKASIDEHYIDITGIDKYIGNLKWSNQLRQRIINETGLPISFGIAPNKTIAKIATGKAKPNGLIEIKPHQFRTFLDPLSIRKIPMIGEKSFFILQSMGITSVKQLFETPPDVLKKLLGKSGIVIWQKANGIDNNPVKPNSIEKSISSEITFETDCSNLIWLKQKLITLVEKTAYQLRKKQKLTSVITVKIRYSNFETHTLQKQIIYTAFDHILLNEALELFNKIYKKNTFLRLIGIKLSGMINAPQQLNMFEDITEMTNLYSAVDKIRSKFGEKYLKRAIGIKTTNKIQK